MRCHTRSQRETGANIAVLLLGLFSAIAAFRWNPLYGPWLWIFGWGAALLVAMATVVAVAGLRSAHERCENRPTSSDPAGRRPRLVGFALRSCRHGRHPRQPDPLGDGMITEAEERPLPPRRHLVAG